MLKEKKTSIINQLEEKLARSSIIVATSYQGIKAKDMTALRIAMDDPDIEYQVVKNNLIRIAAQKAGKEDVMSIVEGPTAVLIGYDDVVKAVRLINQYIKSTGLAVSIKGALLGERMLYSNEVMALANLPSREVLISQVAAMLKAPMRGLHNAVSYPLYGLHNVLKARIQDLTK
jgi:large subunit ribosomal protein L10